MMASVAPYNAKDMKRRPTIRHRLAALVLAPLLLWTPAAMAVELGGFFEHTLYTKDGEPAEAYKPRVILLLHGFKSAMPNHDYYVLQEAFGGDYTVAGFNYDYLDVDANRREFEDLFGRLLKDRKVIVLGTSLGGFWADQTCAIADCDGVILINPAVDPADVMRRALGEQYSKKRQLTFTVTEAHVDAYADATPEAPASTRRLLLLAADDELLDHRMTAEAYAEIDGTETTIFETGGHNLPLERPDVMETLRRFIAETWKD